MSQRFFEVFPTLVLEGDCRAYMELATVERIATTRARDLYKIYITCNRLIEKQYIYDIEKELQRQLFSAAENPAGAVVPEVKIYEKFHLSDQYDAKKLFDVYMDSILLELKNYSPVLYSMVKKGEFSYPDGKNVLFSVENIPLHHQKEQELLDVFGKIVCERCGITAVFDVAYTEPKESRFRKEDDIRIARKVEEIVARTSSEGPKGSDTEYVDMSGAGTDDLLAVQETKAANAAEKQAPKAAEKTAASKKESSFGGKTENRTYRRPQRRSDNPDVIYGYDIEGELTPIDAIVGEIGEVAIRGQILSVEEREIRNEKTIYSFTVTDFTDTIKCKMFCPNEELSNIRDGAGKGKFVMVKGLPTHDSFDRDIVVMIKSIQKSKDFRVVRNDHAPEKRVELHCHTKMSDMDGVADVVDIIKRAYKWGHPAIAITDHGVVAALADMFHPYLDMFKAAKAEAEKEGRTLDRQDFFKVIIGSEIYLVDDLKNIVTDSRNQSLVSDYVIFDIETTGFSNEKNNIIEIGAVKIQNGKITDRFSSYVNPEEPIPFRIEQLTGINDSMVVDAPKIETVLPQFLEFCEGAVLVAHNADFDIGFIRVAAKRQNLAFDYTYLDTVALARVLLPNLAKYKLDHVAKALGVSLENHHRAVDDAGATAEIFEKFIEMLSCQGVHTLDEVNALGEDSEEAIRKLPSYHAIVLAKNDVGRVNLYKLISESHLKYFNRRPKVPKSLIMKYREGLILGSACEAGELYRAILDGRSESEIAKIVRFYDYLEIQPLGNNAFMIESDKVESIRTMDDIKAINKQICDLGEQFDKPVCATCDVHFLDPEDEVYRRIIMAGKGFKDADSQAPLYLRTTDEMLEEFEYLGSDKAREVVITNTNRIADMVDVVDPVRPDKCPPVIENSDQTLTDICYRKAHEIYGEVLPDIVKERLERELNSIISNGFAVMYIIAQKLVWKSVEDGYLVGSRGSVGSSFVAYAAGITEVNSLSPHYYCKQCHYYDFDSEEVLTYSGMAGCDMPDKYCPNCGKLLVKDGFDIPFETFLGFKGDKEPDIDLNFSGEYQSKAHKYTEVIFGAGQAYRAGTIGTLADKTAYGYVKNYYEERGISKRSCEIERIAKGCEKVRRSTGQHPGGIIVLPLGEEIDSFTPVQHPANDMTTDIVTTHFDYHKIDHNLLKLDILGHDDPTMIRMLQDLTGLDPTTIPLDDKQVMSLFQSTQALGVTPEELGGCKLGALGIPEFGTDFAMQMLIDAGPTSFSDLVRISGLSHGTDVWLGNAKTLIEEGKATISTAVCTRDDIMVYLISKGVESALSFTIMESVRKGKGVKPEWEETMLAAGVPDWYIWSCKKIKYMFPKAHAAAYVMMAWRIAYCKVYYPLAYYTAFFSIRATAFSYEIMCQGRDYLERQIDDYKKRKDSLSNKEQDTLRDMRIVQEMYARGFEFMKLDLYRAHARNFQIIDGKIMPSFSSIEGMGDKAAEQIMEAAKDGPFLSKDDLKSRSKVPQGVLDRMGELGLLGDIPESNQYSLFDLM
ncbi:MAG: PolC-type DNA polymerase III [Lachnospiraceae bacterium]|nr:PolC-type DNA polymerase III [Lachnospiraceae bacterium]